MSKLDLGNNEFINYEFHENIGKNTIVFSNSLGSDLSMWDPQAEYFKDDYHSLVNAIEERDLNLFGLTFEEDLEQRIDQAFSQNNFDVLIISIVQFTVGLKFDFDFL